MLGAIASVMGKMATDPKCRPMQWAHSMAIEATPRAEIAMLILRGLSLGGMLIW